MAEDFRKELLKAIKKQGGMSEDEIKEAARFGANQGFPGFTYYRDTVKFYDKNKDLIWELLNEAADSMGEGTVLSLIASFGGAKHVSNEETFKNLLAWFALEEIGNWLESEEK